MDMQGLYAGCRTYRRFKQEPIPKEILEKIVNTARERSSAMNGQILRYLVAASLETVKKIQPCLSWAPSTGRSWRKPLKFLPGTK